MMNRQLVRSLTIILVIFGLFVLVAKTTPLRHWDDQLYLLMQVRRVILDHYVEKPDEQKMVTAAARAMAEALGDPHTVYIPPEELQQWDERVTGTYFGIGATVEMRDERPHIVSPFDDSPAYRAGAMAGDVILQIEGEDTRGMPMGEVLERLRGERGTQVTIRVRHETGDQATLTIVRDEINIPTIRGLLRGPDQRWQYLFDKENRIGYIRISQFTERTAPDLRAVLEQVAAQDARGLILDVRFNPGGRLDSAVDLSGLFLDGRKKVVAVRGRREAERVYHAPDAPSVTEVPIVVLINEASASAAEILAGALSDHGRAALVGTRSFGKGSVQEVVPLLDGQGAVKITHAHFFLPGGRNINRLPDSDVWGVDPDEGNYVPMTTDQVRQMREIRRDLDALRPDNDADRQPLTPKWIDENLSDPQLAAAHRAMLGRLADGDWPQVGESGGELLVQESRRRNLLRQRELLAERLDELDAELDRLGRGDEPEQVDGQPDAELDPLPDATDDGQPVPQP